MCFIHDFNLSDFRWFSAKIQFNILISLPTLLQTTHTRVVKNNDLK